MEHSLSVLLVDDEEANRLIITRRLQQEGYLVTAAENGRRALELMRLERFDLVLLDLYMPEMDGLATLDAIKSDEALSAVPVVMLTAAKTREAVVQSLSLGAADYLVKPVSAPELRSRVKRCLESRGKRAEPTIHVAREALAGTRVLVVDDEPLNLRLLEFRLGQIGYKVLAADSGRQALELLAAEPVDAMLLDIHMEGMDGLEVLRTVRGSDSGKHMPILMLSADAEPATIEACYQAGADDYVLKPYHSADLQLRLAVVLEMKRGREHAAEAITER